MPRDPGLGCKVVFFQETKWTLRPDVLDWDIKSILTKKSTPYKESGSGSSNLQSVLQHCLPFFHKMKNNPEQKYVLHDYELSNNA